jgi:Mrp family chromosome partitioning ATPase
MHVMARDYDFVIVEADPLATPSGLAAAFAADQLVLTAIERTTLRIDIERVIERAARIGASVVGVVVSAPSRKLRAEVAPTAEGKSRGGATARTDGVGKAAGWVPDAQ